MGLVKDMMVSVYSDADYLALYKQKQTVKNIFIGITAAYALFCIAWVIYFTTLPYKDPMQTLPKVLVYVATAIYVAFTFLFMGIKYSRLRRYYKMMTYVSEGLKNEEKNYFYCFDQKSLQKDNLDVIACVFETWNKKKHEWMEREAYFDPEKPLPDFQSGDYVHYIVQSNFVIQYDILQRHALEFEEVDDEEEESAQVEESVQPSEENEKE